MVQRRTRARRTAYVRAVIFDFDGTIADSFEYVFNFLRNEAKNKHECTAAELKELRTMSMKRLALRLGVPFWRLPFVYVKGRRVMRAHMEHVPAFKGMPEAINELHQAGWSLFVVSSNSTHNVRHLLRRYDLAGCFTVVRGNAGFMGKALLIRQLLRRYRLRRDNTWYVGDEAGDIVGAAAAGVPCLAVTWGFADPKDLKIMEPAACANRPHELVQLLEAAWQKR